VSKEKPFPQDREESVPSAQPGKSQAKADGPGDDNAAHGGPRRSGDPACSGLGTRPVPDLLQRTRADFENYQKRNQKERAQDLRYANTKFAEDLLPVIDNLERATAAARQANEQGPLVQGVALVQNQFQDILKRHGVARIDAQGNPSTPNLHQAVMQETVPDQPPDTVARCSSRVIRFTTGCCARPKWRFPSRNAAAACGFALAG